MEMVTRYPCVDALRIRLSAFERLMDRIIMLLPDQISHAFDYDSDIPIAAVCLNDCRITLGEVMYSLDQACVEGTRLRGEDKAMEAVFFERFYLDNAALRLYSAAEHLAAAVRAMLDVPRDQLPKGVSEWERVRKYLSQAASGLPLTEAVRALRRSRAWRRTMAYRGKWVHHQPPTVAGMGLVYHRRRRWEVSDDGKERSLVVGPGDSPEHTTEELADTFSQAFADFLAPLEAAVNHFYGILEEVRITETPTGLRIGIF